MLTDRFWSKVNKNGPIPSSQPDLGPCWVWLASKTPKGYGQFWMNGTYHRAHILAFGPRPEGLLLDHLCRNRACCNPKHLEPVTPRENILRGQSGFVTGARRRAQTHCKHGHEYTPENTIIETRERGVQVRRCRTCVRGYRRVA